MLFTINFFIFPQFYTFFLFDENKKFVEESKERKY